MFDYEVEAPHVASWLIQQIAALLMPLVWVIIISGVKSTWMNGLESVLGAPGTVVALVCDVVFVWGSGFWLGYLVQTVSRRAASVGRLVWILPCTLYMLAVIWELLTKSLKLVLLIFFTGKGEEGWVVLLITFPTSSSILYSLGICLAKRRQGRLGTAHSN